MTSKGAIPKGARSKVWRHFENVVLANDDQHVLCILCKQNNNGKKTFIKVGGYLGTQGMRNHLRSAHPQSWRDIDQEERDEKKAKQKPSLKPETTPKIDATFQQNEQNQPSWCAAGRVWQGPFGLTGWQVNNALFLFYSFSFLLLRFFLLKGRKSWCCQVQQRSATRNGEKLKRSQCGAHIQDALLLWLFRWKIYDIKRILADVLITRNGITEELGKRH